MPSRFALILALATAALTLGQAWALDGGRTRILRYLVTWVVGSTVLVRAAMWMLQWRTQDIRGSAIDPVLTILGCIITAFALGVGGWRAQSNDLAQKSWSDRFEELAIVHAAVLLVGSGVGLVIVMAVGLWAYR